ncbi:MAG: HDIG domain-containing protein [Deltaproteobacteria bacterium]|nr:HDIG domain-containing protein [Deltaproteobacteria bacterium]
MNPTPSTKSAVKDRQTLIEKRTESVRKLFYESRSFRWVLLLALTLFFVLLLHPHLIVTQPSYKLGDVAERNIKAPQDFFIEDYSATEANRRRATEDILTVYDHDTALLPTLNARVAGAFDDFQAEMTEAVAPGRPALSREGPDNPPGNNQIWQHKEDFARKIGIDIGDEAFKILMEEEFPYQVVLAVDRLLSVILGKGVVSNRAILLRDAEKGIVLRDLSTKNERAITDLKQFLDLDQARAMVRNVGEPLLKDQSYALRSLVIDLTQRLIQPNITVNRSETEERKKLAAGDIRPVIYKIKAGEMLLREGERVTEVQLLKLDAFQKYMQNDNVITNSIGAALLVMCLFIATFVLFRPSFGQTNAEQNKRLLFVAFVLAGFFLMAQLSLYLSEALSERGPADLNPAAILYATPLAAGSMIICLFLGFELALPCAVIMAVLATVIFQADFPLLIYFLINGTMAAYWIRNCRERKVFIRAGTALGLLNLIMVTAIDIYLSRMSGQKLLWDWIFAFSGGIGSGIVAAGIIPLVEIAFDYTTDIKLLELANLDRPILRQLLMEAPGTYHHSVIVGSMVEAAASEIGANSLLAKVCGYYHDIGKIKKPLYFIENQHNGKNKHDKLAPSMSSLILVAHVKNGIEIAQRNRLGPAIIDTIQQHHGTSLITYFYDKAKQQKGEDAVKIEDFRYPGPKPQTREVALVMLADVVEAASRTLANPTPSRIQGLVQNLINKVFSDGQLDNCELTLKDLHKIAKSFNKILNAIHHHRIEYPEKRAASGERGKFGNPDRQPPKQPPDFPRENSEKSPGHLRRLGQF